MRIIFGGKGYGISEIEELVFANARAEGEVQGCNAELAALRAENERLKTWVNDLHSGMYINCVYCGHRYGPNTEVPASMADVLKAHCEQCPEHPLSAAKARIAQLEGAQDPLTMLETLAKERGYGCCPLPNGHNFRVASRKTGICYEVESAMEPNHYWQHTRAEAEELLKGPK